MDEKEFTKLRNRMNKYKRYDSQIKKLQSYVELLEANKEMKINFNSSCDYWLVSGNEKDRIVEILKDSIHELEIQKEGL